MDARPVDAARDGDFLFEVYVHTRAEEVRSWGFGEAEALAFLRAQHGFQLASYARSYPNAERLVLLRDGAAVGQLYVDRAADHLTLVDISILPEFQSLGIGASAIRSLQQRARASRCALRLSVRHGNPARRLYERLGFRVVSQSELDAAMEWREETEQQQREPAPTEVRGRSRTMGVHDE